MLVPVVQLRVPVVQLRVPVVQLRVPVVQPRERAVQPRVPAVTAAAVVPAVSRVQAGMPALPVRDVANPHLPTGPKSM